MHSILARNAVFASNWNNYAKGGTTETQTKEMAKMPILRGTLLVISEFVYFFECN